MNWCITGGCGFIGTSLIARLRNEGGHAIRVIDNFSVGRPEDVGKIAEFEVTEGAPESFPSPDGPVQILKGDICDPKAMMQAAAGADALVHLAANTGVLPSIEDPVFDNRINVAGTLNVLEAARHQGVQHFVMASSGAVLGEQEPPIHEDKTPRPVSPYGASKLAGEAYCSVYSASYGVNTVALRFGNVYGPRSALKASVVAKFAKQALAGETLTIYGDGAQTRDFIFIDDLTRAICLAAELDRGGEIFQIATNRETTVNEMVEVMEKLFKELGQIEIDVQYADRRAGEVLRNYSDISKSRRILKWEPEHNLEQGLRKTIQWFLDRREGS